MFYSLRHSLAKQKIEIIWNVLFLLNRSLISFHMCNFQIHDLLGCVPQTMLSLAYTAYTSICGGPHLPSWAGGDKSSWSGHLSQFPVGQSTCENFAFQKQVFPKPEASISLFFRNWVELVTERLAFVSWYVGVSLELFLFLIICVVKLDTSIRASHSTECHLTPHSPKLRYQH